MVPFGLTDLQVRAHYRFSLGKLKVLPHEKVEQGRCFRLGGARTMVAALEDFVAQTAAQVRFALEECAGELKNVTKRRQEIQITKKREYHVCSEAAAPFVQRV